MGLPPAVSIELVQQLRWQLERDRLAVFHSVLRIYTYAHASIYVFTCIYLGIRYIGPRQFEGLELTGPNAALMLTARHGSGVATVTKGWEFIWEGQRYCVGPPDAPTARKHLRAAQRTAATA